MKKLGFGFMRLPILKGKDGSGVDVDLVCKMVDSFLERGFTYFDTAYMYHNFQSEVVLRETLVKRYPRDKFTVATKMPIMFLKKEEDLERIFNEQLEKCGVEYFDYYLLHNLDISYYKTAENFGAFEFVEKKKREGFIKKIGFSYHDNASLLDKILKKHPEVDFIQLQINYLDWDDEKIQSGKCYDVATKHGKPIIVMEPVKGGALSDVPSKAEELFKEYNPGSSVSSWAIRFAASNENVMLVLSGMSNMEQLKDNTNTIMNFKPFTKEEYDIVNKAVKIITGSVIIPCTACEYCTLQCPQNIPIPKYFALYNTEMQDQKSDLSLLKVYYHNYTQSYGKASDCIKCKKCEPACPQHIEITKMLKDVAKTFEKKGIDYN